MAETERYPMGEMKMMQTIDLIPHKRNSEFFDDIVGEDWADFVESIKQNGIIEPIVVDQNNVIISGHQRLKAARELGLWEVPVVVKHFATEDDALLALLDTNVKQRGVLPNNAKLGRIFTEYKKLNEVKHGNNQYKTEDGNNVPKLTEDEIADKLGYDKRTLRYAEKVSQLPAEFQELIENGTITASAGARLIASMDGDEQAELFAKLRNFPQAHFTNDDIERFKKEVQEKTQQTLTEMREDFKERMEEKEAEIRAEYEEVIANSEAVMDEVKRWKKNYREAFDRAEEYEKKYQNLVDERADERYRMIQHDEGDGDASFFAAYCKDFLKGVARYQYVMDGFERFGVMRQEEIRKAAYAMKAFIDNIIDCIDAGKGIEE